jgi:hypothetical protein
MEKSPKVTVLRIALNSPSSGASPAGPCGGPPIRHRLRLRLSLNLISVALLNGQDNKFFDIASE